MAKNRKKIKLQKVGNQIVIQKDETDVLNKEVWTPVDQTEALKEILERVRRIHD